MAEIWLLLLGFLLAGYFVLGGYDYGVQMLTPLVGRDQPGRRSALAAVGPFFLGNEVWLVAFVGVMFGAFPFLEGTLLAGLSPLFVVLLLGLVVGTTALQLRSRWAATGSRRFLDAVAAAGGAVSAATWGVFVAVLLRGVPIGPAGTFALDASMILDPFVGICALTAIVLFAAHGATFLALRSTGDIAARATRLGATLAPAASGGVLLAALVGLLSGVSVANAATALVLALLTALAPVLGRLLLHGGRFGPAFAAGCVSAAAPVLMLGLAHYPAVLASTVDPRFSVDLDSAAADPSTLGLLAGFGVVLVPVIIAFQVWSWWVFRGRVDGTAPSFY